MAEEGEVRSRTQRLHGGSEACEAGGRGDEEEEESEEMAVGFNHSEGREQARFRPLLPAFIKLRVFSFGLGFAS